MANILLIAAKAQSIVRAFDEDEESAHALIAELEQMGMAAVAPLCDVIDELTARAGARKEKARATAELARKDEAMTDNMKSLILKIMQVSGQDKMSNGALSITVSKGRESVEIVDESKVPMSYKRANIKIKGNAIDAILAAFPDDVMDIKEEVDKKAITEAHKAGVGVNGTEIVRKPYLIIKG